MSLLQVEPDKSRAAFSDKLFPLAIEFGVTSISRSLLLRIHVPVVDDSQRGTDVLLPLGLSLLAFSLAQPLGRRSQGHPVTDKDVQLPGKKPPGPLWSIHQGLV